MKHFFTLLLLVFTTLFSNSQTNVPGKIIRAATGGGAAILDAGSPSGYVSSVNTGYASKNDTTAAVNKHYFRPIAPYGGEPCCDLRRGPDHRFSDFVPDGNNNGVYYRYDGANLIFRMRMGDIIPGAKGFSILVDTDLKYGQTGTNKDPNFVAKTTGINGNPGFELEIVLQTGSAAEGVAIYRVDGLGNPSENIVGGQKVYTSGGSWEAVSQIALAATNENGDPDYFIDWYVPMSALTAITIPATSPQNLTSGTNYITSASQNIRFIPTTVMAPKPSVAGPISDIYGDMDSTIIYQDPQCFGCPNGGRICTAAPQVISAAPASVVVAWKRSLNATQASATIKLYANGVQVGNSIGYSINNEQQLTINGLSLTAGQTLTATAEGVGEAVSLNCFASNGVIIVGCTGTAPAKPLLECSSSSKGISSASGYVTGNTITVENLSLGTAPQSASTTSGPFVITGSTWTWNGSCSNGSPVASGYYRVTYTSAGCTSEPSYVCISAGSGSNMNATASATPSITTPAAGALKTTTKSIVGTGEQAATVYLYVNNKLRATTTATGTVLGGAGGTFTFNDLDLKLNDQVYIVNALNTPSNITQSRCGTNSITYSVTCFTESPVMDIDANLSKLAFGQPITGTAPAGSTVDVYLQSNNSLFKSTTANADGIWTTSPTVTAAATTYYAITTVSGCASARSTAQTSSLSTEVSNGALCSASFSKSDNDGGSFTTVNSGAPLTALTDLLQGTLGANTTVNTVIAVYINGSEVARTGTIPAGTNLWGPVSVKGFLYNGAEVNISIIETGKTETVCNSQKVVCACSFTPSAPILENAGSTNIPANTSGTIKVTNPQPDYFYSVRARGTGAQLSKGVWYSGTGDITVTGRQNGLQANSITFETTPISSTTTAVVTGTAINGTESCTDSAARTFTVLPITLLEFRGVGENKFNNLYWKTAEEINASHFVVEKSRDAISFTTLTVLGAQGSNSSYTYNDVSPDTVNYYRLRMVDIDGRFKFSSVILIRNNSKSVTLDVVRPNPFTNRITFSIVLDKAQTVRYNLVDASGKMVRTISKQGVRGLNNFEISDLSGLAKGFYTVRILANETVYTEKLVKSN